MCPAFGLADDGADGHDLVYKADTVGFLGFDIATAKNEFEGAAFANKAGKAWVPPSQG